ARGKCSEYRSRKLSMPSCAAGLLRDPGEDRVRYGVQPCCCPAETHRSLGNHSVEIPKIFPTLVSLPQKDLPLYQAAIPVDAGDGLHVLAREEFGDNRAQVCKIVRATRGLRNRNLAALDCPLDADHGGMHAQALRDRDDYGIFDIDRVLRSAVALRTR